VAIRNHAREQLLARIQERTFDMRDDFLTADWASHHSDFAAGIDRGLAALRSRLGRFADWDGTTHQLLALIAAFAVTGLSIGSTSGAA
jgi:hypothetical protein